MLDILPTEVTVRVLYCLPIPSLLTLPVLSRQWFDFFATNQSAIFHSAALLHEYIQPGTWPLEDALAVNTGMPWAGSTSWKDFCRRSFQLHKNWEGKGRAVMRVLTHPGSYDSDHYIKVDERAGICITTHYWGGLTVTHLFSGVVLWRLPPSLIWESNRFEYDNGYLVFDHQDGTMEIWRLANDLSAEGEVAAHAPPDDAQMDHSARAAELYHHYAPRGHFRPWALLEYPEFSCGVYRLAYPTLICVGEEHAFLHDVRTGSLLQTIDICFQNFRKVDVSERHALLCETDVVHVFSRESGSEVLRIPADATVRCSQSVEDPVLVSGDWLVTPLSVSLNVDESFRPEFFAARVSKDGRDIVVLSRRHRVVFIRDFERICRGETTLELAGLFLGIQPEDVCSYLGFEHGRVCVATRQGLYIFTFGPDLSAKAVFVRPSKDPSATPVHAGRHIFDPITSMQLTDRRIYFTWAVARRRDDIPLFEDAENAQELPPPPIPPILDPEFEEERMGGPPDCNSVGCIDFSLMPEGYASDV